LAIITALMPSAPWLAHYDSGVPQTLAPYPDRTLLDYLSDAARESPDAPAFLFKGSTTTFAEAERESDAFASALAKLPVTRGDRLARLPPNRPQFFLPNFALGILGQTLAPPNPIYREHELEGPLRDNGIETIVTLTRFYQRVKNVQPRTPLRRVIATNI